jgi:hypothetical protein
MQNRRAIHRSIKALLLDPDVNRLVTGDTLLCTLETRRQGTVSLWLLRRAEKLELSVRTPDGKTGSAVYFERDSRGWAFQPVTAIQPPYPETRLLYLDEVVTADALHASRSRLIRRLRPQEAPAAKQ